MKYTRIYALTIIAIALMFAACKKQQERKGCFYCVPNDSVYSNIPALNYPHFYRADQPGDRCNFTKTMIDNWAKQNTYVDTYYYKNDTLMLEYHTMQCQPD